LQWGQNNILSYLIRQFAKLKKCSYKQLEIFDAFKTVFFKLVKVGPTFTRTSRVKFPVYMWQWQSTMAITAYCKPTEYQNGKHSGNFKTPTLPAQTP